MFSLFLSELHFRICLRSCCFYSSIMPKYAVAVGHKPGIYDSWAECSAQVKGCKGATFKKFNTEEEAQEFIDMNKFGRKRAYDQADAPNEMECSDPFMHFMAGKLDASSMALEGVSSLDGLAINSRITMLEDKINSFMDKTSKVFDTLIARIAKLENACNLANVAVGEGEQATKKARLDTAIVEDYANIPEDSFKKDEKGFVCVYTDGACSSNGRQGAKAGIGVWFNHNHPLNVSAPVKGPPTNNTAEIQAARVAITQAAKAGVKKLALYTDSKFVIDCITKWIHRWKKNDWKLTTGGPVKNKTELIKLDNAIQLVEVVDWVHVRGHMGIVGNEMADSLAKDGASKYSSNLRYADSVDGEDSNESTAS